jgi:hypothetical protein
MAEIVEHELMEKECNLQSFIKETTEFLQKLNKIPKPLPGNYIMFCLDVKRYTQVSQERKQGSRVKSHYKSVKIHLHQQFVF